MEKLRTLAGEYVPYRPRGEFLGVSFYLGTLERFSNSFLAVIRRATWIFLKKKEPCSGIDFSLYGHWRNAIADWEGSGSLEGALVHEKASSYAGWRAHR
jgi:hypothetical protein